MRKPKNNIIELPQELKQIASDLSDMVAGSINSNINALSTKKEERKENPSPTIMGNLLPENTNQWSSKDFVHYFSQKLQKDLQIPYIIEYSRDCSAIKKIKDQLTEVGISDSKILKNFINWSINNYTKLREHSGRFDLSVLNKFLNEFIQYNSEATDEERSLGFNILQKMEEEIVKNPQTGMISLLKLFGIPLTAEFYYKKGSDPNKIFDGINNRLKSFGDKDIIMLHSTIQRSIDFSPYPEWFCCTDWRNKFQEIIFQYKINNLKWWRDLDYAGTFAVEYEKFKGEHNG